MSSITRSQQPIAAGWLQSAIIAFLVLAAAVPAKAQPKTEPPASVYRQLFPQPTGKNGYEEVILAGETARSSRLYLRFAGAPAADIEGRSLSFKRRVLADPPVVKALSVLRRGLAKPLLPLRRTEDSEAGLHQMRLVRTVGRLLAVQQYVLLADGRVPEAISVARQGLRLGQLLYTDPQITGLLGLNTATGSLRPLAARMDQLSARDCELLYQLCLEWLRLPDPQTAEMAEGRRLVRSTVAEMRAKITKGGLPALQELQVYEEEIPEDVKRALAGPSEALDAFYSQVEKRLDAVYAHQLAQFRKPPWERIWDLPPDDGSPAAQFVALVHPPYEFSDHYNQGTAFFQLFASHCAIRRYRWEHDRLPAALSELNLGQLAVDPFTGQPFSYEVRGATYRLTSAGPTAEEDDPKAVNGRVPLSIVPGD